jgi:hypothetical protein
MAADLSPIESPSSFVRPAMAVLQGSNLPAHMRSESGGRNTSPFELTSPRLWTTPPSPMTVDQVQEPLDVPEA